MMKVIAILALMTLGANAAGLKAAETGDKTISKVIKMLQAMIVKSKADGEKDLKLFAKYKCYCDQNAEEKATAIADSKTMIDLLAGEIGTLQAENGKLSTENSELDMTMGDNERARTTAEELRTKGNEDFKASETDMTSAISSMDQAIDTLSAIGADQTALLSKDSFMGHHTDSLVAMKSKVKNALKAASVFLTAEQKRSVTSFIQAEAPFTGEYQSQSGEIVGILKTMKEQMEGELKEAQESESAKAGAFSEMRAAKQAAIEAGEKLAEQKEDELAKTDNLVAEAKEDLGQTEAKLQEDRTFLANLDKMCATADQEFEKRKESRLEEIKAVGETIEILTADEARDAMAGTYNFLQLSRADSGRKAAASILRNVAQKTHNIDISFLASRVELDAFTKVKKAIDDMISTLQTQQADEVKKNDYCKEELQTTEMTIMKTNDLKADLEAKVAELESNIVTFTDEISAAKAAIEKAQIDLQRASEDRLRENRDFQKTVADQTMTIEVMLKAMDRLAQFYDQEFFLQKHSAAGKQTPPVQQMEYKPNAGAGGVLSMIEKLISEAKELVADSKKSENDAQVAYETLVADTNQEVDDLAAEVTSKTKALAKAKKDKLNTESDLMDTVDELEGLHKYEADVHAECDYVLKNFNIRQEARAQEIEALQQAKQILNGANLS